jgi:hypothetical protein
MNRPLSRVHYALAGLTLLAIVVQFFLAGLGVFGGRSSDLPSDSHKTAEVSTLDPHRFLGTLIILLALLLLLAAAGARLPRRDVGLAGGLFLLTILQLILAGLGTDVGAVFGALHVLNALLILGLSTHIFMRARAYAVSPAAAAARTTADIP